MGKVYLKIPPWVAGMWQIKAGGWLDLEREFKEGMRLKDLLRELLTYSPDFRTLVFNPETGNVSDQIMVLLNDTLLQNSESAEAVLKAGDTVTILPIYAGG